MADFIDRDILKKRLTDFSKWCRDGRKQGVDFVLDCPLPDIPAADVVPRSEVEKLIVERETYKAHSYNVQTLLNIINQKIAEGYELSAAKACAEMEMWQRIALEKKQLTDRIDNLIKNYAECQKEFAWEIISEFKNMVINYVKDRDLLLVAFKNAVAYAETELKKKYIGE